MNPLFDDFVALSRGRFGTSDVLCPFCDHQHRKRRRTMRLWRSDEAFLSYHCARCSAKGWSKADRSVGIEHPSPDELARIKVAVGLREKAEMQLSRNKALRLWTLRRPVREVPQAVRYLRAARNFQGTIPATVGALPAENGYPAAVIAAFGFAEEMEPGTLDIADSAVRGVHLIRLNHDGSDRDRTDKAKITIGRGSSGVPIVVAPPNDLMGLTITEGLEDALAVHESSGLGAWAAGGASRMPALVTAVPFWIDCVAVIGDNDSGREGALKLAHGLSDRGLNVELRLYDKKEMAL